MTNTPQQDEQLVRQVLKESYLPGGFRAHTHPLAEALKIDHGQVDTAVNVLISRGYMRPYTNGLAFMTLRGIQETERLGLIDPEFASLRRRALEILNAMITAQHGGDDAPMLAGNEEMKANETLREIFSALRNVLT